MSKLNNIQHTGELRPRLLDRADIKSHSPNPQSKFAHANDNHRPDFPPSTWSPSDERVVDLFCGAGGLSLGFQAAGFPVMAAVDAWPAALATYRANYSHPAHEHDLADVRGAVALISRYSPSIIVGGPPCQDFSRAGRRVEAGRADLTVSFAEVVSDVAPRLFVMENVPLARRSTAYKTAYSILEQAGYGLTEQVLDASLCGVPQVRKRLFLLGRQRTAYNWLATELENSLAPKPLTIRRYLGDELGVAHYYHHPRFYGRKSVYGIDEAAPTLRGGNKIKPCPGVKDVPTNAASVLITRGLEPEQRARIQTFPASYRWLGSQTAKDQMIGNAVPVELAKYVASAITRFETSLIKEAANDNALTG